jgi:hypothetical protein
MLASISKIKSFRETGDFDLSSIGAVEQDHSRMTGLTEHGAETPQATYLNRDSTMMLGDPTLEVTRNPPLIEEEKRAEASRGYMTNTFKSNQSAENMSLLGSNF